MKYRVTPSGKELILSIKSGKKVGTITEFVKVKLNIRNHSE